MCASTSPQLLFPFPGRTVTESPTISTKSAGWPAPAIARGIPCWMWLIQECQPHTAIPTSDKLVHTFCSYRKWGLVRLSSRLLVFLMLNLGFIISAWWHHFDWFQMGSTSMQYSTFLPHLSSSSSSASVSTFRPTCSVSSQPDANLEVNRHSSTPVYCHMVRHTQFEDAFSYGSNDSA